MEQRIPPQNVEAEQAVLGAMLLSHDAVIVAMEKLQPRDFTAMPIASSLKPWNIFIGRTRKSTSSPCRKN